MDGTTQGALASISAPTELQNPRTTKIDVLDTTELLMLLNAEDAKVPAAVRAAIPQLAALVDRTVAAVAAGGRLHYFGAGTSGRIAVMDCSELLPTFGIGPETVVAHMAGGIVALSEPVENIEDSEDAGAADAAEVGSQDVVLGIAASGRTPYVGGALRRGTEVGAFTALISSNPRAPLAASADLHVLLDTGPEPITGSTRMKAGTAQKLALNALSTALAVRLGHTYSNFMVDMIATNQKLRRRLISILHGATGQSESSCIQALDGANGELKTALVCLLTGCEASEARAKIAAAGGSVRAAADTK